MRFGTFVELFTPAVFSRGHKRSPPHLHAALQICVPEAPVQRSRFNNILPGFNCWQSNIVKESPPICRCMSYWKRTICMTISVLLGKQLPIGLLKAQSERNHSTQQIWSLRVKAALYTRKYHIYIYIYTSINHFWKPSTSLDFLLPSTPPRTRMELKPTAGKAHQLRITVDSSTKSPGLITFPSWHGHLQGELFGGLMKPP